MSTHVAAQGLTFLTPASGDLMLSSGLQMLQAHMWCTDKYRHMVMSPRYSTKRSGPIFYTHGRPWSGLRALPTQAPTQPSGCPRAPRTSRVSAPPPPLGSREERNSGGEALPVAAAPRTARRKTKSGLPSARVPPAQSSVPPSAARTGGPQVTTPGPTPRRPGTFG